MSSIISNIVACERLRYERKVRAIGTEIRWEVTWETRNEDIVAIKITL